MIETRHLKNVAILNQTILSFVLSRKIINTYNNIARKDENQKYIMKITKKTSRTNVKSVKKSFRGRKRPKMRYEKDLKTKKLSKRLS